MSDSNDKPEAVIKGGFQRLYMVDSTLAAGFITMLPLTGNTMFVGPNGVGKTSRMALVAFFFGAAPSDVVSRGKEKKFDEFYLPRKTSYLAMDYRTADGQERCVVVYMAGQSLAYRLVQASFDRAWIQEGGRLLEASELTKRLLDADVAFNPTQITTTQEYRGIIQGIYEGKGKPGPEFRRLRATYSLAGSRASLPKIDKIILGMIGKMVDLRDLAKIVLANIESEDDSLGGNAKGLLERLASLDKTVQQGYALTATREAEPHYETAEVAYKTVRGAQTTLSRLLYAITQNDVKIQNLRDDAETAYKAKENELIALAADYAKRTAGLKVEKEANDKTRGGLVTQRNELEARKLEWDEKNPAAMENRAENEGQFAQQLQTAEGRLASFTGEEKEHKDAYETLCATIHRDCDEAIRSARAYCEKEVDRLEPKRETLIAEKSSTLESQRAAYDKKLEEIQERNNSLANELSGMRAVTFGFDAEMMAERSIIEAEIEGDNELVDHCESVKAAAKETRDRLRREGEQLQQSIRNTKDRKGRIESEIEALQRRINADSSTLLGFLRSEVTDWEQTIGKVIAPKLLERSDLSPKLSEEGTHAVFGVSLNLAGVLSPEDEDTLRQALEAKQRTLEDYAGQLGEHEAKSKKLSSDLAEASRALDEAQSKHEQAIAQRKRRRQSLTSLKSAQAETLNERERTHKHAIEIKEEEKRIVGAEKLAAKVERDSEIEELDKQLQAKIDSVTTDIKSAKASRGKSEQSAKSTRDKGLAQAATDLEAKLKKDGLGKRITELKESVDRLKNVLLQIKDEARDLRAWQEFKETFPPARQALSKQIDDIEERNIQLESQIETLEHELAAKKQNIERLIASEKADFQRLDRGYNLLMGIREKDLSDYKPDPEGAMECTDPDVLIHQVRSAQDEMREAKGLLEDSFRSLRKAFTARPDSEVAASWRKQEIEVTGTSYASMQSHISEWYQYQQGVAYTLYLSSLATLKLSIDLFTKQRSDFHRKVQSFGRRLKSDLKGIEISSAVSNLTLNITSDSRDDSFMPKALQRLNAMSITEELLRDDPQLRERFIRDVNTLRNKMQDSNTLNMKPEQMISITGEVTENGNVRRIDKTKRIDEISSSGLTVMIQSTILMAFIEQIRGDANVEFPWALDELGMIDDRNIVLLVKALNERGIHLLTAQPGIPSSRAVFESFSWALEPTPQGNIQAVEMQS